MSCECRNTTGRYPHWQALKQHAVNLECWYHRLLCIFSAELFEINPNISSEHIVPDLKVAVKEKCFYTNPKDPASLHKQNDQTTDLHYDGKNNNRYGYDVKG